MHILQMMLIRATTMTTYVYNLNGKFYENLAVCDDIKNFVSSKMDIMGPIFSRCRGVGGWGGGVGGVINKDMTPMSLNETRNSPYDEWCQFYLLTEAEWRIYASVNLPSLVQIMARRPVGYKPLSEPNLNTVNWTLMKKFQWKPHRNVVGNVVWKMTAILSRPQYVKVGTMLPLYGPIASEPWLVQRLQAITCVNDDQCQRTHRPHD